MGGRNTSLAWLIASTCTLAVVHASDAPRAEDLAAPVRLRAGGEAIHVDGYAAPFSGDFDGDGRHDLLVGQMGQGRLRIYRNIGTNGHPEFDGFTWFQAGGKIACVPSG